MIALSLAGIALVSVLAQWLAWSLRVPAILFLLLTGLLLGPVSGLLDPDALLGDLLAGKVNQGLANSALYLKAFGHAVIGWRWLEQAIRAEEGLANGNPADADFYKGKLQAARYFLTWEVPSCHHELAILEARDDTCLGMQDTWF